MNWRADIAIAIVLGFFLTGAATVVFSLSGMTLSQRKKRLLILAIVLSVLVRLGATQLSISFVSAEPHSDITTWFAVAQIMESGRSVYAVTDPALHFCKGPEVACYNFAPGWAWISFGIDQVGRHLPLARIASFRLILAALLAITDVLSALILAADYSLAAGVLFLFIPPMIWIEAYQGPFNNLAILLGLFSWHLLRKHDRVAWITWLSAALLGVSLVVKHVLILFPIWLLFYKPAGKPKTRLLYAAIAYSVFLGSFLPWWFDPASRAGIIERVVHYSSNYGRSAIGRMAQLAFPVSAIDGAFRDVLFQKPLKLVWLAVLVLTGMLAARRRIHDLFLCYLLALYGFSIALWEEYLVIPMLACSVYRASWGSWAFILASSCVMLIREAIVVNAFHPFVARLPHIADTLLRWAPDHMTMAGQWAVISLFVAVWRDRLKTTTVLSTRDIAIQSVAGFVLCVSLDTLIRGALSAARFGMRHL